jgi:hypothetical protein
MYSTSSPLLSDGRYLFLLAPHEGGLLVVDTFDPFDQMKRINHLEIRQDGTQCTFAA